MARSSRRPSTNGAHQKGRKAARRAPLICALSFGVVGLITHHEARAAVRDEERAPRHVEVKIISDQRGPEPLEKILQHMLGRLQVTIRLSRVEGIGPRQILSEHPNDPDAVARVWIDLREPRRVTVYLSGNREDRVLVRHVPIDDRLDDVGREEVAHIVEASVDALLIGGRIGVSTDEPRKPTTVSRPAPRPEHALDLELSYQGHVWSSTRPAIHGPAVSLSWVAPGRVVRPFLLASGSLRFPVAIAVDPIALRLDQQTVRLLVGADWNVAGRWRMQAAVGAGVDWVRISSSTTSQLTVLDPDRTTVIPMARAMVALRFGLTLRTEVFSAVGADMAAWDVSYTIDREGPDQIMFQPWRLRPFAMLGLAADLLPH